MNGDECRYCGEHSVVPVLDKSIERSPTGGGNKYRRRCLSCYRWAPMTSREHYEQHAHPHVLPVDADSDAEGSCVPLEEYDYGPEWEDLAERVGAGESDESGPSADVTTANEQPVMTDGGTDEEPENSFVCPYDGCDAEHTGYPDECDACGAVYEW